MKKKEEEKQLEDTLVGIGIGIVLILFSELYG
jgi:hypothetical protein